MSVQEFDCSIDEEPGETRGCDVIHVANASTKGVNIELTLDITKSSVAPARGGAFEASTTGGKLEANVGERSLDHAKKQCDGGMLAPHNERKMPLPDMARWFRSGRSGRELLTSPCIQAKFSVEGSTDKPHTICLAPDSGAILTDNANGGINVEQTKGRTWYGSYKPWLSLSEQDRNPHKRLPPGDTCEVCDYS